MSKAFTTKLDEFVATYALIHPRTTVIVGVSGGADSLALLHYLWGRRERDHLRVIVAHVDHMFRGEQSVEDMEYVKRLCKRLDIPCEATQIDVRRYQEEHGLGSQEAARLCRYTYLEKMMHKYKADYLALGHHGDDQIETILMRLVRGSIGKGYAGIPVMRPFASGAIIRPLLAVSKVEIAEYCRVHALHPRIDPSNEKDIYTRNRFRKNILPYLQQENTHVHERFQQFSRFLQEDDAYLQELAFEKMNKVMKEKGKNNIILSIPGFESLPMPLQRRGIQLILNYLYAYKLPSSLSSIHIEQAMSLLRRSHPSGLLHLPAGLIVRRTYEECSFSFVKEETQPYSYELHVPGTITLPNGDEIVASWHECDALPSSSSIYFGSDTPLPFIVRSRKDGDRMMIKGMNGTKKIKAIFIDEKVPRLQREEWPVVCDAEGTIVWLPLLRQSTKATVPTSDEGRYIRIHYKSKESSRRINK